MQCKIHSNRQAKHFCASCGTPLCGDCAEESKPGIYHCFQCAMLSSVSEGGSQMQDRREKAVEERLKEKKKWGPFRYFILSASVLIVVLWGVIFFGGERVPEGATNLANNPRALLFLVDGSIKRYAYYEKKGYPEKLTDLVPKYLRMDERNIGQLQLLSYQRETKDGYSLSLARKTPGEMTVVLSAKGVETRPSGGM